MKTSLPVELVKHVSLQECLMTCWII